MNKKGTGVNESSGTGIAGTLFIVFLVLKLVGVINWSWWWVTSPLWIPFLIAVVFIALMGVGVLIKHLIDRCRL